MQAVNFEVRTILTAAGFTIVSSCSMSLSRDTEQPSLNSASIIQINRQLEIPSEKARVYIQDGVEITLRNIDKWSTYCSVLMQDLHTAGTPKLRVSPGKFEIIKLRKYDDTYFPGSFIFFPKWIRDPPTNVIFEVEMRLKSAVQPGVRALICAKRVDYYGHHYHPTLAEIRHALGGAIEIKMQ